MAIKGIISAGTKVQEFAGRPVMKVGASNTLKLNREALNILGVDFGDYVFMAPDEDDSNLYYIAGSKEANTEFGDRGSKLGVVGEKGKNTANLPQLQFNHAALGDELFDKAATFELTPTKTVGEGDDATEESLSFEYNGLTFYPMTIIQTRAEVVAEKEANEKNKQEASDKKEDEAIAENGGVAATGRKARGAAATTEA